MYGRADQPADAPASGPRVTDPPSARLPSEPVRRPTPPRFRPSLADRTDASLLRAAREGDPRAYEAIVARYREPLRRSCARITPGRAEDAVQQALLSAWMALERGAEVRELRPWLYSIARNAAIDQARGIRSEQIELGPEVPGGEDPAHAEARRREVTEVLEAVAALPERQRRALVDTALHGRATEAVAVDLGLSGGALRQLVHRARTNVRAAVPSLGWPLPAWLAELLGEEGMRRGAVLLSSGSGAAILAKTTATVGAVGAVVVGGISVDRAAERASTPARAALVASTAEPRDPANVATGATTLLTGATLVPASVHRDTASRVTPTSAAAPPDRTRSPDGDTAGDHPAGAAHDSYRAGNDARERGARDRSGRDEDRRGDGWTAPAREDSEPDDDRRRRRERAHAREGAVAPTAEAPSRDGSDGREGESRDDEPRPVESATRDDSGPGRAARPGRRSPTTGRFRTMRVTSRRMARPLSDRIPMNGDHL
jgi:RNA polymerase sigma factor (sigma-70 family)